MDASNEIPETGTVADRGAAEAGVSARVRQALAAERIEALTRTVDELRATRSELQYDLSVALDKLAEERKRSAVAEEQHKAALAAERHRAAVVDEQHGAHIAAEQQKAAVADERGRASNAERDVDAVRDLAALRLQVARAERDNEVLREQLRRLSALPSMLERRRTQLAGLRERLALAAHDRKALRWELKRRARLLARLRSDLRLAEKSVSGLQRSMRSLEHEKWLLQGEAGANKVLRRQNVELTRLVDELAEGFHAVLSSRRWRLGTALLALPRLLLFRRRVPTAPDAMLRLVMDHRRRRTIGIGPPPTVDREARQASAPGDEDGGPDG